MTRTMTLLGLVTVTGKYVAFQFKLELTIGDGPVIVHTTERFMLDEDFLITEMSGADLEAGA